MPDTPTNQPVLQFGTLEPSTQTGGFCQACRQPINRSFYRVNNAMICGRCADRVRRERPQDSHSAFVRAILFGVAGFALGLVLYAGFAILTGITIGYVSLAVGFIVGKAMLIGSKGAGGRRYQIAAVLLTYAAVSMASIPIAIHYMKKDRAEQPSAQKQAPVEKSSVDGASQGQPSSETADQPRTQMSAGRAIGMLAGLGLASPFLELSEGSSGIIGLIILFVGMRFAWRMTASRGGAAMEGPFELPQSASA